MEPSPRGPIHRQAASIALAASPFGIAFGVIAAEAGLSTGEAVGFSTLVFTGSAQFAAVTVLADGGSTATAVVTGLLLNLRSLAFGVVMAPALRGPLWWRALASVLMIDEATAVGAAQRELRWQRYGFLAAGLAVFATWNTSTLLGVSALGSADALIERAGLDATIPAAFLALLWPRLADPLQRSLAVGGAAIALAATPLLPPGVPTLLAAVVVVAVRPWKGGGR